MDAITVPKTRETTNYHVYELKAQPDYIVTVHIGNNIIGDGEAPKEITIGAE